MTLRIATAVAGSVIFVMTSMLSVGHVQAQESEPDTQRDLTDEDTDRIEEIRRRYGAARPQNPQLGESAGSRRSRMPNADGSFMMREPMGQGGEMMTVPMRAYGGPMMGSGAMMGGFDGPRAVALAELHNLKNALRDQTGDERDETIAAAKAKLTEYFDSDFEHRRSELKRLQQRYVATRSRLDRRAAAKDQMIDLQVRSVSYEAAGLLLFENPPRANSGGYGGMMMEMMGMGGVRGKADDGNAAGMRGYGGYAAAMGGSGGMMGVGGMDGGYAAAMGVMPDGYGPGHFERQHQVAAARRNLLAAIADSDTNADDVMAEFPEEANALKSALSEFFDADLQARTQELARIKSDLDAMAERLDKRVQLKDRIVDLELQMFVNDADGLGFFNDGGAPLDRRR